MKMLKILLSVLLVCALLSILVGIALWSVFGLLTPDAGKFTEVHFFALVIGLGLLAGIVALVKSILQK